MPFMRLKYLIIALYFLAFTFGKAQFAFAQFEEGKILVSTDKITGTALIPNAPTYIPQATQLYLSDGYEINAQRKISNLIKFSLNENSTTYFASSFNATVGFTVERKDIAGGTMYSSNETLNINFDKDAGDKYNPYSYLELPQSEDVKIIITSFTITGAVGWDPTPLLELSNEMRITRYYALATNAALLTPSYNATINNTDNLLVSWTWPLGSNHNMSQLEWAWVEDEMAAYYSSNTQLFSENSTRVDLDFNMNSYKIPLLYSGTGKLYYRVRAALKKNSGQIFNGEWHTAASAYSFPGHETKLNWQSTTSFAENGKLKTVIQYFDGSLRSRQTVTKDNSTNNTVVGETIYDLQGRPNVQILPTPTIDQTIQYFSNFNRFLNQGINEDPAKYFDLTPSALQCKSAAQLDNNYGNGKYYSNQNPWLLLESKSLFVPDARGYAFTETRYTDDASGRVISQGGVGIDHQIGSTHETKYFYGKPSQPELDALFGTEAGLAAHYSKNMVQDANGQISVSYVDMHGRTVATALAGNATLSMQSILNTTDYPLATNVVKNELTTPDNNIIKGTSIESISSILVAASSDYAFTYLLDPSILKLFNCNTQQICFDCKYDLEISIKSENCGDTTPIIRRYQNLQAVPSAQSCNISMGFKGPGADTILKKITFTESLAPGSYIIRKTLIINDSLFQIRKDSAINELLCRTEQNIFDSVKTILLAQSDCGQPASSNAPCLTCKTALGFYSSYRGKYLQGIGVQDSVTIYDELIHNLYTQDSLECEQACGSNFKASSLVMLRDQMLNDMVPYTGQYALDSTINVNGERVAILSSSVEAKFNIFSPIYSGSPASPFTKPFYKYPKNENGSDGYYADENGIFSNFIYPLGSNNNTNLLSINNEVFTENFERPWANQLIKYHPEFSKLQLAEGSLRSAYDWMDKVMACNSYQQALSLGYTNPVTIDPYFVSNFVPADVSNMQTYINSNIGTAPSIWQMANGIVLCQTIPNGPSKLTCITSKSNTGIEPGITDTLKKNEIWEQFKTAYFSYRNEMLVAYINSQTSTQLTPTEMIQLKNIGKKLRFVRMIDIADQNNMPWWQNITNADTTGTGVYAATVFGPSGSGLVPELNCKAQRPIWKQRLLLCDSLISLLNNQLSTDSVIVENILNDILDGMELVCNFSRDAQHPYGASNIPPTYPGTPGSFEEVINQVFSAHGITTTSSSYFCNPYTIEFPKPYGLNPPIVTNYTNVIDSCACKQFATYKQEANNLGFNPLSFNSMNQFFLQNYKDTISVILWQGFQQCDSSFQDSCTYFYTTIGEDVETQSLMVVPRCFDPVITHVDTLTIGGVQYLEVFYTTDGNCETDTLTVRSGVTGNIILNTSVLCGNGSMLIQLPHCETYYFRMKTFSETCGVANSNNFIYEKPRGCYCLLPIIDSVTFFNPQSVYPPNLDSARTFTVYYSIPSSLSSCKIKVYKKQLGLYDLVTTMPISCDSSSFSFKLKACEIYYIAIESYNNEWTVYCDSIAVSDTFKLDKCWKENCVEIFEPIYLPDVVKMPPMFNCGYLKPCITCEKLQQYVQEFRTIYPSFSNVPFLNGDATENEISQNGLLTRFLNYRTGFSKNVYEYMTAWLNCGLDTNSIATDSIAICGDFHPINEPGYNDSLPNPCEDVITQAQFIAQQIFQQLKDSVIGRFDSLYLAKCLEAKYQEQFYVEYIPKEYHYTLYYYDQAGNLVKTLPPAAVKPNYTSTYLNNVSNNRTANTDYPAAHNEALATNYRYNSLNQVIAQKTPDAGISQFWYDKLGRLVVSQNAEQAFNNKYSYTMYDQLGRITQVGQKPQTILMTQIISQNETSLSNWLKANGANNSVQNKEQITRTVYDVSYFAGGDDLAAEMVQRNLRNRVSYTQVFNNEPSGVDDTRFAGTQNSATHYSYDIHGNVDTLVQDYGNSITQPNVMNLAFNRYKKIAYNYDLISGKVNMVSYQPGKYYNTTSQKWQTYPDRFYHHYNYDAENRLTEVYTSSDSLYWEREGAYDYYRHGPLARTILGQLQVQGLDYAYTLHGWLKGVNSTTVGDGSYDIGQDGKMGTSNAVIARDAFGFALHYYQKDSDPDKRYDYLPIGGTNVKPFANAGISGAAPNTELYNGNIGAMSTIVPVLGNALLTLYRYDQLNRLVKTYNYNGLNPTTNSWSKTALQDYRETISYDPNGNIRTYERNGNPSSGAAQLMDNLTYQYEKNSSGQILSNRLRYVHDQVTSTAYTEDIDNQTTLTLSQVQNEKTTLQTSDNYAYDKIGNLIKDVKEGITNIEWTVYGKIKSITKSTGTIEYTYDASGNRISKTYAGKTTWYVRDASGNVMSIYESGGVNSGDLTQTEIHLYGSSRLGILNLKKNVENPVSTSGITIFERGNKFFELSNHLGNVLVTIADRKLQHTTNGTTVDYYEADVITANDYYPGGMQMPGRSYSNGNNYRYGFNGKELDKEVVQYDYGFRIYDPRLVRFKSVDPLSSSYPYFTPYQFASNNPIVNIDLDGLEGKCVITDKFKEAFIRDRGILDDYQVKYAISQGQTVIMTLTYAIGPEDKDSKEITLNDGGLGAEIMRFNAQTNGINAAWGHYFTVEPPALVRVTESGELISTKDSDPFNIKLMPVQEIAKKAPQKNTPIAKRKKSINTSTGKKVKPSNRIVNFVPSIIISDGADNGNVISTNLDNSLNSIKKGDEVSSINVNIIYMADPTRGQLTYFNRAKSKIEKQVQNSIGKRTGVNVDKIRVNVEIQVGKNTDSKTTIIIK